MSGCGCDGAKCQLEAGDPRHGRATGYSYWKCRCDRCTTWNRETHKKRRDSAKGRELPATDPRHGTSSGYVYWECRCDRCREWKSGSYLPQKQKYEKKRWAALSPEGRELAREVNKPATAKYRQTPKGRAKGRMGRQRRREREAMRYCGCATADAFDVIWELDGGQCAYCGDAGTDYEHVVPLARGGWGCVSNYRIACRRCNSMKGARPLALLLERLAASGVTIRPGATNSGLPCPAAAERMSRRMLTASPTSLD